MRQDDLVGGEGAAPRAAVERSLQLGLRHRGQREVRQTVPYGVLRAVYYALYRAYIARVLRLYLPRIMRVSCAVVYYACIGVYRCVSVPDTEGGLPSRDFSLHFS